MSEKKNYIKEELLDKVGQLGRSNEKIADFRGNLNKFTTLNSKIQSLNSIAGKRYKEAMNGKNDLKNVLNFVLEKKGLGGKNDTSSKAYFKIEDSEVVLVLNTVVDGKINKNLSSQDKIGEVLKMIDLITEAQKKIEKHKMLLSMLKDNINGINKDFKKNSTFSTMLLNGISILTTGEEKINSSYNNSLENTKNLALKFNLDFYKEYHELKKLGLNKELSSQLEDIKNGYSSILKSQLEDREFFELAKNQLFQAPQDLKNMGYGTVGLIYGTLDAAIIQSVMFFIQSVKFPFKYAFNSEFRKLTNTVVLNIYNFLVHKGMGEKMNAAIDILNRKLEEISKLPQEKQALAIGKIFGEVIGALLGVKGVTQVAHMSPVKYAWKTSIEGSNQAIKLQKTILSSFDQVKELNKVTKWSDLLDIVENVEYVRFVKDVKNNGQRISGETLKELLLKIKAGDSKILKDLPKGKIRSLAEELVKHNGVIYEKNKISRIVKDSKYKAEGVVADVLDKTIDGANYFLKNLDESIIKFASYNKESLNLLQSISKMGNVGENVVANFLYVAYLNPKYKFISKNLSIIAQKASESEKIQALKEFTKKLGDNIGDKKDKLKNKLGLGKSRELGTDFEYMTEYKDGIALIKVKGVDGKPKFGYINELKEEVVEARFDQLDKLGKNGEIYFERDGFRGYINNNGKELFSIPIEENIGGKIYKNHLRMDDKTGRFLINQEEIINGKIINSYERYGLIRDGQLMEGDLLSLKKSPNIISIKDGYRITRHDSVNGISNYKVVLGEGKDAKIIEFNTKGNVKINIDKKNGKINYFNGDTFYERNITGEVREIKFIENPKIKSLGDYSSINTGLGDDGKIYIFDSNYNIKHSFEASKVDFIKESDYFKQKRFLNTYKYRNIEIEGEFMKIYEGKNNMKIIPLEIFNKGNDVVDISKFNNYHSIRRIDKDKYILGKNTPDGVKYEIVGNKLESALKEKFDFEFDISDLQNVNKSDILIVTKGESSYVINLKKSTVKELSDDISLDINFDDLGIGFGYTNDGKKIIVNKYGKELVREGGEVIKGKKGTRVKSFEMIDGNISIETKNGIRVLKNKNGAILIETGTHFKYDGKFLKIEEFALREKGIVEIMTDKGEMVVVRINDNNLNSLFKLGENNVKLGINPKNYLIDKENKLIHLIGENGDKVIIDNSGKIIIPAGKFEFLGSNEILGGYEYIMNGKIGRVSIDGKVNSGAKYINYTKEINDNFFYFSEDGIDIYRNGKIKGKIEKGVSIIEVIEDKAILNKDNKIFVVDISKGNKVLFEFDESVKKVNVVKKDGFKIEYFITEGGDGKKGMYFRDGKKGIDNIFDDIILDKEKGVFLCGKDGELSYYSYRGLKRDTREIFSGSGEIKVRDINVDVPLLNTLDIGNRMLGAERKVKKIIGNETDNFVGESGNIIKALYHADIKDVMFGLSKKNLKIHENFQGIIQKLFSNKGNIDLFKELNATLNTVFDEYLENIYKSRMRKLSVTQLDYLQKTFREKVINQFIDNINIVKSGKKLQADYSPEMKAYFDTFAKVYNPVIPIEKPKQSPKKSTN